LVGCASYIRNADVWKAAPIVANVSQFRSWVAVADAQAEKYRAAPTPIDFGATKQAVRDKDLVTFMEDFYKTSTIPPETHEWAADDKAHKLSHYEQVKEQAKVYSELKEDTMKEIEFLKTTRTTDDTTVYDLMCNNPTVHEEIEDEIERREWFKDIGLGGAK
jgi:ATP synthase D chain, mitochondrial (ATP5H)